MPTFTDFIPRFYRTIAPRTHSGRPHGFGFAGDDPSYDSEVLTLTGVSKRYGSVQALSDVSFTAHGGEVLALVGENGAGKSTVVRCVARAVLPDSGSVVVDGVDAGRVPRDAIQRGVSVVWQDLALCENLDITANLFLGREIAGGGTLRIAEMHSQARALFASLNVVTPDLERSIRRLSGGQRQLVAIARAMPSVRTR